MSKLILTLVFFLMVTPTALIRKAMNKDSLQLKKWKQDTGSVYRDRSAVVTAHDLENMF